MGCEDTIIRKGQAKIGGSLRRKKNKIKTRLEAKLQFKRKNFNGAGEQMRKKNENK